MIMRMVQEGKITPEQGVSLLDALKSESGAPLPPQPPPTGNGASSARPDSFDGSASQSGFGGWGSLSQVQRKLAETQQRLAEMQAKLGAAQAGGDSPSASGASNGYGSPGASNSSIKLPFGMGDFNISQILDETLRGVTALKSEAVISAKKAARQAQKEARRFRHEAERMGKNIHVEVHVRTDGERPRNPGDLPERSERSEQIFDMPASGIVSLVNFYGDVRVAGTSADGKVRVTAEKTVWADAAASGDEILRAIGVLTDTKPTGDLSLTVGIDPAAPAPSSLNAETQISVQLSVELPATATLHVKTTFGQVQCESLEGGGGVRSVETTSGDIRLLHVYAKSGQSATPNRITTRSGSVSLSQWRGGALAVETVSGSIQADKLEASHLRVSTHSGDMHLQALETSGELSANTSSGDITLEKIKVASACSLKSQSGDIELTSLEAATMSVETVSGDLVSHGCACASGRVSMKSISGDIEAEEISATDVSLNSTSGKAEVALNASFTGSVVGASVSGDLEVTVPAAYAGRLTLTTHSGEIDCKAPLAEREGDGKQYISGRLTGKPGAASTSGAIMLQSVSGDLKIDAA